MFDSVNHLPTFEDWELLFDRVGEHLSESGVFIMDCNTIAKLEKFITLAPFRLDFEGGYQMAKITKDAQGVYHFSIDVHKQSDDGKSVVSKSDIPEVVYPLQQIKSALERRFKNVEMFNSEDAAADESDFRVYFSCSNSM